ncbi:Stf0 family sulfotransferase [Ruegeria sp. PrR005]|uniref:Stf0 sulfotransferase n=1 Tax=Ruegeria sp. PrR005 TaxID=2706882 RepID=A0A6B2NVE9_9RHOB|nr:Stf0 family sulfotransferase [Ruegeria sp. PrR005]NDW45875.1 Stf0 sulfotransferase [Ruegeria sp. PrR005]
MTEPAAAYILCGTPRSGSTLLCGYLTDTGVAGQPDSFFRTQSIDWWAEHWGLPSALRPGTDAFLGAYLAAAIAEGRGDTPVFGLRLMRENLGDMSAALDRLFPGLPTDAARIDAAFGPTRYLHLRRRDKLAQAISLVRAEQSGLWHVAPDGTEVERLAPHRDPVYDFDAIDREVKALEAYEQGWTDWFAAQRIVPLAFHYEDLADTPERVLSAILDHIGQDPAKARGLEPTVARLSDGLSAEWAARYREDAAR